MSVGERPGRAVALASKNRTAAAQQDSLWRRKISLARWEILSSGRLPPRVGVRSGTTPVGKQSEKNARERFASLVASPTRGCSFSPRANRRRATSPGCPRGSPPDVRARAGTSRVSRARRPIDAPTRGSLGGLSGHSRRRSPRRARWPESVACESVARAALGIGVRDRSNAAMPTSDAPVPPELVITAAELAHVTVRRARATPRPSDRARERVVRCSLPRGFRPTPRRPTPTLTLPPPNPSPPRPHAGERPRPHGDMVRPVSDHRPALVARGPECPPPPARFPTPRPRQPPRRAEPRVP
jgi:hypothetical protein